MIGIGLSILAVVSLLLFVVASGYFFYVAEVRSEKDFVNHEGMKVENPLYEENQRFLTNKRKETWKITSEDGLKLCAWFLKNEISSQKTAILIHGYNQRKEEMAEYGTLFAEFGYNVLIPDNRAHGESEGKLVGFGWLDRKDVFRWLQEVLKKEGGEQQIVIMGISMGAAATMMFSGEELPENVRAFIEDSGYDTAWNESAYKAKKMYHLPEFPLLYGVSFLSKIIAGYSLKEADAVKQLEKNTRPMLFIHGDKDDFVPFSMLDKVYAATKGAREKLVVRGAKHVLSYETEKEIYKKTVREFLEKYVE